MTSQMYRLMIYFAHSTLVMYEGSIISEKEMSLEYFRIINEVVCERVFQEGLSIFNYELSSHQMDCACSVYIRTKYFPQKVEGTSAFVPAAKKIITE